MERRIAAGSNSRTVPLTSRFDTRRCNQLFVKIEEALQAPYAVLCDKVACLQSRAGALVFTLVLCRSWHPLTRAKQCHNGSWCHLCQLHATAATGAMTPRLNSDLLAPNDLPSYAQAASVRPTLQMNKMRYIQNVRSIQCEGLRRLARYCASNKT
jgi:hypothetical protein